jgi:uncharacterized membrane protein HdeD (DUF308 family)
MDNKTVNGTNGTKGLLRIAFLADGIIAIGFGIYSWCFPHETFGTIIAIPAAHASEFLSILSGLSLFYLLIGLTCLIGIKAAFPVNILIALLMGTRHMLEGVIKAGDMEQEWLTGNPYPDLAIHAAFAVVYILAIYFTRRRRAVLQE